jgi:hypothetical protein
MRTRDDGRGGAGALRFGPGLFLLLSLAGCAGVEIAPDPAHGAAPAAQLSFELPGGERRSHALGPRELAALAAPVRRFEADGRPTRELDDLLVAGTLRLPAPADQPAVVAHREGRTLLREDGRLGVTWNQELDHLEIRGEDSLQVDLEGVPDALLRAKILSRLAASLLGANLDAEPGSADVATAIVVALSISYVTCVTAGQAICSRVADSGCQAAAFEYNMICGAGYDVASRFHLGFHCSYRCGTGEGPAQVTDLPRGADATD